jgi:hypothetical protein
LSQLSLFRPSQPTKPTATTENTEKKEEKRKTKFKAADPNNPFRGKTNSWL